MSVPARDDDLGWMTIAQHFHMKTRLLDFSASPLVALRFATAEMGNRSATIDADDPRATSCFGEQKICFLKEALDTARKASAVFVAKPKKYAVGPMSLRCIRSHPQTFWYSPAHFLARIRAQQSYFAVQPNAEAAIECIAKIVIPATAERQIKISLERMGFGYGGVYPGLEGVVKDVDWWMKWDGALE